MESPGPGHSERRRTDIAEKQAPQMSLSNAEGPGQLDDRTVVQCAFLNEAQCVPHDRRSIVCRTIRIVQCRGIACSLRNGPAEIGHLNGHTQAGCRSGSAGVESVTSNAARMARNLSSTGFSPRYSSRENAPPSSSCTATSDGGAALAPVDRNGDSIAAKT